MESTELQNELKELKDAMTQQQQQELIAGLVDLNMKKDEIKHHTKEEVKNNTTKEYYDQTLAAQLARRRNRAESLPLQRSAE